MANGPKTWQEQEAEAVWQGDADPSWKEKCVSIGIGMVPVVGPMANCIWNVRNKRYFSATIDGVLCIVDAVLLGTATNAKTTVVVTKKVYENGVVIAWSKVVGGEASKNAVAAAKCAALFFVGNAPLFNEVELADMMNAPVPGTHAGAVLSLEEAHGSVPLPSFKIPLRALSTSNFLILYDQHPRMPTTQQIMAPMTDDVKRAYRLCLQDQRVLNHVGKASCRLWTDNLVYKAVNAAIISDNPGLLNHWMPYVRALNNYILGYHLQQDVVTRRKSNMSRAQANQVQEGRQYRLAMYVATSKQSWEDIPDEVGGNEVRIEFSIPSGCFQACDAEQISMFQHEKEVLLVPYSPIFVTRKVVDASVVTIFMDVAKDGRHMDLGMEVLIA